MTTHDPEETTSDQPQQPQPQPGEWFVATIDSPPVPAGSLWIFDPRPHLVSANPDPMPWRCVDTADPAVRCGYARSGRFGDEPGVIAANGLVRLTSTSPKAPDGLRLGAADKFLAWKRDRATPPVVDPDLVHDATVDDVTDEPEPKSATGFTAKAAPVSPPPSGIVANVAGGGGGGGGGGGSQYFLNVRLRDWGEWFAAEAKYWEQEATAWRVQAIADDAYAAIHERNVAQPERGQAYAESGRLREERNEAVAALDEAQPGDPNPARRGRPHPPPR